MRTYRARSLGHHGARQHTRSKRSWQKWLAIGMLCVVAGLLYYLARDVDWPAVWQAVRAVPKKTIAQAVLAAVSGYVAYACMDLLGRRYIHHKLPPFKVAGVAMLSYALNLNLGMLLGGFGARLRLYLRMGCRKSVPTRVALFSALSNWVGFGWLAGALFASGVVPLPANMAWGQGGLRIAGFVCLALSLCYVAACARYPGYAWTIRRWRIVLPGVHMALAQSISAILSWGLMGLVLYIVLQARIPYLAVLGVLLYASIAALVVRVPGGLGTTEAITVAALGQYLPPADILAAVLTYRAIYFLCPLGLALVVFGALEGKWSLGRRADRSAAP